VLRRVKGIAITTTAPTWCATRWWRASSMPTTLLGRAHHTRDDLVELLRDARPTA
jgi:hypothetical protein